MRRAIYPGSFDPVFEHVSFQLDTDWRLGLTGRNGRGKTTLVMDTPNLPNNSEQMWSSPMMINI